MADEGHERLHTGLSLVEDIERLAACSPIEAPGGQVLGDQHRLSCAAVGQRLDLSKDRGARSRTLIATEGGDGAEPTAPVAPFGHLHVGPRTGRSCPWELEQRGLGPGIWPAADGHPNRGRLDQVLAEASHEVNLRQRVGELLAIALCHAAGDHKPRALSADVAQGEDGLDGLLSGGLDEGAGVDDDEIGIGGVVSRHVALRRELADELVGVHLVLRTAEGLKPVATCWHR